LLELLPAPQEQNTTLASRLIPLSLKAKTGSMTNINGLAGFYLPQNSLPQAFFLMMSNFIAPIKDINEQQKLFLQRYLAD
jgi:D-alanyl-D-alanine carboxypeptidase